MTYAVIAFALLVVVGIFALRWVRDDGGTPRCPPARHEDRWSDDLPTRPYRDHQR